MPQSGTVKVSIKSHLKGVSNGLSVAEDPLTVDVARDFPNGTADGQANNRYSATRTLGSGATEDLDLAGGLSNLLGSIVGTKLCFLYICADKDNTTTISLTRSAANGVPIFKAAGDGVDLMAGDFHILSKHENPITITAATADLITVTNSAGAPANYDIVILLIS